MIKLTKLYNKRRIEEERTPPENDFGLRVACFSPKLCLTSCANYSKKEKALCQMLGYSPYESSLAPIICMVGAILFAQK